MSGVRIQGRSYSQCRRPRARISSRSPARLSTRPGGPSVSRTSRDTHSTCSRGWATVAVPCSVNRQPVLCQNAYRGFNPLWICLCRIRPSSREQKGNRLIGRQRNSWEENVHKRTSHTLVSQTREIEDRERWKAVIVQYSAKAPQLSQDTELVSDLALLRYRSTLLSTVPMLLGLIQFVPFMHNFEFTGTNINIYLIY